ncbi:hypothetical protein [Georgenia sp. MJ170]|uniref:hypothetical protein n=1 Tax=Georgenia sunbinii TaxID=3117728 RepID=UPI002F26367E
MGARIAFTDRTPWAVGVKGAIITAENARGVVHDTTAGAEGVVRGPDLRVRALDTPGESVRVGPGSVVLRNRYPGGDGQSYRGRTSSDLAVPITATGSGAGRSDLVVARVVDPQYEPGMDPDDLEDPNDFDYVVVEVIEGVSPSTTGTAGVAQLANVPAVPLARIDLPVNTGTVEARHITDLRAVAVELSRRRLFAHNLEGSAVHELRSSEPQYWPEFDDAIWWVDVPEWATHANIVAGWNGVRLGRSDASGTIWARIGRPGEWGEGNVRTQDQKWDANASGDPADELRESWEIADDVVIPAAMRGTRQPLRLMGRRMVVGSPPRLVNNSSIKFDVQFTSGAA